MDKSWIDESNHTSSTYLDGVIQFLNYVFHGRDIDSVVYCPCRTCLNRATNTRREILLHCIRYGFDPSYRVLTSHGEVMGETSTSTEDRQRSALWEDDLDMLMRNYAMPDHLGEGINEGNTANDVGDDHRDDNNSGWRQMLEDMQSDLIPGCKKISRLTFIARLLHLKVLCQWSNHSVDLLLELLRDALPDVVILPKNYYEANKITKKLGFNYKSIDACINNCMLFTRDDVELKSCAICGASRFIDGSPTKAAKKMRYFPIVPRLQRWLLSSKTIASRRWHAEGHVNDGLLRHLADSAAWKNFNRRHLSFSSDIRNIGSRILLISRGLEKRIVSEGVLLSDPTPGDTIDIVRVFVTTATIPEAALILRITYGAQTLGEVVRTCSSPITTVYGHFDAAWGVAAWHVVLC
ncbi:uncharacterized protein LOC127256716 [Andrographis paniculata]|uniref:uncharacterized protein LOC127256716 n=1 Tax=Andrographis paniculata TaxID=175694 RepID=UPI0021E990D7|nr:uncharacterized protein LOC127256716 [Andrographis paniculata]